MPKARLSDESARPAKAMIRLEGGAASRPNAGKVSQGGAPADVATSAATMPRMHRTVTSRGRPSRSAMAPPMGCSGKMEKPISDASAPASARLMPFATSKAGVKPTATAKEAL